MDFNKIFHFLIDLQINNNRAWFNDNKDRYLEAKQIFDNFVAQLIIQLKTFDKSIDVTEAKDCVFRIYRDTRFSNNKAPYKENFGAFITRGGRKSPFAGYYIHIEPDQSFAGGGIYHPQNDVLKVLRQHIFNHVDDFKKIIDNKPFNHYFKGIYGDQLKMAPKGFPKDFTDIDLLKYKDYAVVHQLNNDFFMENDVMKELIEIFKAQQPFNRFLNSAVEKM